MSTVREQLILSDIAILETSTKLKVVQRTMLKFEDLKRYAGPQLPIAAVTAGLPKPKEYHKSPTGPELLDMVTSELLVEANIYFRQSKLELVDSTISEYAEELLGLLWNDQSRGNLCLMTTVEPHPKPGYWTPFGAFKILIQHTYNHKTGGI